MLERLLGADIEVSIKQHPGLGLVKVDRGRVEQVLMNLSVNARDAMPAGGALTIETEDVELDEDYAQTHHPVKPGNYVALYVSDSGTGMSPEVRARLFEPFFTTKEVGKGTGLGLATVHGIVAQSGGSINVYTEEGLGTTFKIYLPLVQPEEEERAPGPPSPRVAAAEQTVLVVDDVVGLRELARRLLERHGYNVLVAASAQEAIALYDGGAVVDVLLTDVVMPGGSRPELTHQLLQRQPDLKVIYMSGYTEESIIHRGTRSPMIAFLGKPFSSETLGRKIREILER